MAYDRERFLGRHRQLEVAVRLPDHGQEPFELTVPVLVLVHQRPGAAHAQRLESVVLDQPAVLVPLDLAQVTHQLAERHWVLLLGGERHAVEPAESGDGHGQVAVVHVRAGGAGRVFWGAGGHVAVAARVFQHDDVLRPPGAALVAAVHEHGERGPAGPVRQVFDQERHHVLVRVHLVVELPVGLEHGAQQFHGRLELDGQPGVRGGERPAAGLHGQPPERHDRRQPLRLLGPGRVPGIPVRVEHGRPVGGRAVRPVSRQHVRQP